MLDRGRILSLRCAHLCSRPYTMRAALLRTLPVTGRGAAQLAGAGGGLQFCTVGVDLSVVSLAVRFTPYTWSFSASSG